MSNLLVQVQHLAAGIEAIGQSRDQLTRRVWVVALGLSSLLVIAVGLSGVVWVPGTQVRSYAPLLLWGPLTVVAAAVLLWRGISHERWCVWTGASVVIVIGSTSVNGFVTLILTLCLLPVWHVVHPPRAALVVSLCAFAGVVAALVPSQLGGDAQVAIRLLATYLVLVVFLQAIMRHVAHLDASVRVLGDAATGQVVRLESKVADAMRQAKLEKLLDVSTGLLSLRGLEAVTRGEVIEGAGDLSIDRTIPYLLVSVQLTQWEELYAASSVAERHLMSVALAHRLRATFVHPALVARIGSAEFVVLSAAPSEATAIGRDLEVRHRQLAVPLKVAQRQLLLRPAIGVSVWTAAHAPIREAIDQAEIARAQGRRHQSGRPVLFNPSMRQRAEEQALLAERISQGLDAGEFELHYQPIVQADGGGCRKAEGLVRWRHPERGLLSPAHFLDVLEEYGLGGRLFAWAIATAAEDVAWCRQCIAPAFQITVNVSPDLLVLETEDLSRLDWVVQAMHGTAPHALALEVTEAALVTPSAAFRLALQRLRDLGALVIMDDFGTGYSTLARLAELPVDGVKIDRLLISKINESARQQAILRSVITMARELSLRVTAEGVETVAEATSVVGLGCHELQGFLFSSAVPREELVGIVRRCEAAMLEVRGS